MMRRIVLIVIVLLVIGIAFFWVAKRTAWAPALLSDKERNGTCRVTGCSGQICAENDIITSCEVLPAYGCYKTAVCERQSGGNCDWTESEELKRCIENGRVGSNPIF